MEESNWCWGGRTGTRCCWRCLCWLQGSRAKMTFKDHFQSKPFCDSIKWGDRLCEKARKQREGYLERGTAAHHPLLWVLARIASVISPPWTAFECEFLYYKTERLEQKRTTTLKFKTKKVHGRESQAGISVVSLVIVFAVNLISETCRKCLMNLWEEEL